MPTPSRKTPQRIAKLLAMQGQGQSAREIGDALGLSHRTVAQWLADAGLEPNGGQGARKGRVRREPDPVTAAMAGAAELIAVVSSGPPPSDRAGAIRHLQARLQQISTLADQLGPGVPSGKANPQVLAMLIRIESEQCTRIAELTPPEVPDPQNDPAILNAAAEVERKLMLLVEAARRDVRCARCGENPYHGR